MFELARKYKDHGMAAYSELQQAKFASEQFGYIATRHQREVGTVTLMKYLKLFLEEPLQQLR
jgi:isocitrate lyase